MTSGQQVSALQRLEPLAWGVLYLALALGIQFLLVSVPYDADTAYHAAVGSMIREHGILHAFPWTPFSWLAEHYADKELLLHLLYVPFIKMGWITASRIVGGLLGGLLLFAIYLVLRCEKVRCAGLWALLPLITSDVFLFRFALVRPHLMSITLAFVLLWALIRRRWLAAAVAAVFYPWAYVAFWQMPLILLTAAEGARLLSGRRIAWKPAAAVAGGLMIGWALHPNSLNLLKFNWIHMVDVLFENAWQAREGIELGIEFLPFTLLQWLQWLTAATLMTATALIVGWRNRRADQTVLSFALATLAFTTLSIRTARFAEYFIPFAAAGLALASVHFSRKWLIAAVFGACLLYTGKPLGETAHGLSTRAEVLPPKLAAWMQQNIPAGSQVFTTEWGHTGTLMLALPERKFIVALDPTLFLVNDPQRYRIWYELPRKPYPGMADTIRTQFGARYVVSFNDERFTRFYFQLSREPGVKTLLALDDNWTVYDLGSR